MAFSLDAPQLGAVLGYLCLIPPAINVTTGFCVPSVFYRLVFGRRRATKELLAYISADGANSSAAKPSRRKADVTQPGFIRSDSWHWLENSAKGQRARLRRSSAFSSRA